MVRSMTAFGRSQFVLNSRAYVLEIHSVNRKGLEVFVYLPPELSFFEVFLRNQLRSVCARGHLICKILSDSSTPSRISQETLKKIHQNLNNILTNRQHYLKFFERGDLFYPFSLKPFL